MDAAIPKLIERAELCNERSMPRVAKLALIEAFNRLEATEVSDEIWERMCTIADKLGVEYDRESKELVRKEPKPKQESDTGNTKCQNCNGTGMWGRVQRICFQCEGKGYQTPADRRRTSNFWAYYWAERKAEAQAREESS